MKDDDSRLDWLVEEDDSREEPWLLPGEAPARKAAGKQCVSPWLSAALMLIPAIACGVLAGRLFLQRYGAIEVRAVTAPQEQEAAVVQSPQSQPASALLTEELLAKAREAAPDQAVSALLEMLLESEETLHE